MPDDRSKHLQTLRRLGGERLEETEVFSTLTRLRFEGDGDNLSDQASVLIAAALVEQALEAAIAVHFPNLDPIVRKKLFDGDHEREGILGTLYTRAIIGQALEILSEKTTKDILVIKDIRNLFAHSKRLINFNTDPFPALCNFYAVDSLCTRGIFSPTPDNAKSKLLFTCMWITSYLTVYERDNGNGNGVKFWKTYLS